MPESVRRVVAPGETIARVRRFLPLFGITRLANVTGLDDVGIPVVMCNRPNSRSLAVSQGKGVTLDAAKASALMESIESWHAERITLPLRLGSVNDLRFSHPLVDVNRLPRLGSTRFTPNTGLLWIEGRGLIHHQPAWVPFEMVHTNWTQPFPTGHGCFLPSSNGLASGNILVEAIIHGLCEVIERDALTLFHLVPEHRQAAHRVDLATVTDPVCRDLLARFEAAGVAVAVWDITSDTRVPAFLCRIVQADGAHATSIRPAVGAGAHLQREIALARALTEAAQSRLTFISGARDDIVRADYERTLDPAAQAKWLDRIRTEPRERDFADIPSWVEPDLQADLDRLLQRVADVGAGEPIVVDLTKPELKIAVARVIVPGLEGPDHSPDYALGRRAQAVLARAA